MHKGTQPKLRMFTPRAGTVFTGVQKRVAKFAALLISFKLPFIQTENPKPISRIINTSYYCPKIAISLSFGGGEGVEGSADQEKDNIQF